MLGTGYRGIALLLAGTASCLVNSSAWAAGASITALESLSTQAPESLAWALDGDGGKIVGGSVSNSAVLDPVLWSSDGSAVDLGGPYTDSFATGISEDGSTIVGEGGQGVGPSSITVPWVYSGGTFTTLPMTLVPQAVVGQAVAASADGSVIAGSEEVSGGGQAAVIWSGPGWATETGLGGLAAGDNSWATAMDAAGATVVGDDRAPTAGAMDTAFYWRGGTMTALPISGYLSTEANAISADGSTIVGGASNGSGSAHAVMWNGSNYSVGTDLGTLGGTESVATGVSGDGSIIVGYSQVPNSLLESAFRYKNGSMADLNTLLTSAGVDLGTIHLDTAGAISADGRYILANDGSQGYASYLVYYDDNPANSGGSGSPPIGGLTTPAAQQASADQIGQGRQAVALKQDSYTSLIIGDFDALSDGNEAGAFGVAGSALGGLRGRLGDGHWTMTGGIGGGEGDVGGIGYRVLTGAAALRYSFGNPGDTLRPFVQVGGSVGALDGLTFTRTYANGAGTATGVGTTDGQAGAAFVRAGLITLASASDSLEFSGELGERWLHTDAYAETLSPSNPFPALVAAATDGQTVAKAAIAWTHDISPSLDLTLRGAIGAVIGGESGLQLATSGVGTFATGIAPNKWAEFGARLGWKAGKDISLDIYATETAGENLPASTEIGAGLKIGF